MKRTLGWSLFLVLVLSLVTFSLPAQTLDDVIEDTGKPVEITEPAVTGGVIPADEQPLLPPERTFKLFASFPIGFPSFDSLFGFLNRLIQELFRNLQGKNPQVSVPSTNPEPTPTGKAPGHANPQTPAAAPTPKPTSTSTPVPPSTPNSTPGSTSGSTPEPATGDLPTPTTVAAGFPGRDGSAMTGNAFLDYTDKMSPADREKAVLKEILAGNMPDFLRQFKTVTTRMKLGDGKEHTISYQVMPDYLAIGSNADYVRMPMSPITAQAIAERFGCILPTTKMVDDIYKQAQTKLNPQPMSGGQYPNWQSRMTKNEFYREHQRLVESQLATSGSKPGDLVAGHKKDVVISNFLNNHQKNVVIYGWHDKRNGGKPIQGYGYSHENTYSDYSHGIRLIQKTMMVDGQEMQVADVLKDPVLSRLLSNEGAMQNTSACR